MRNCRIQRRGSYNTGGLAGLIDMSGSHITLLETVASEASVATFHTSVGDAGGLVGKISAASASNMIVIANARATGNVNSSGYEVGGLIGYANKTIVLGSYATGFINQSNPVAQNDRAGGLIGRAYQQVTLDTVYATGDVYGDDNIGGLIGWSDGQTSTARLHIANSYARGSVYGLDSTGTDDLGGLIGEVDAGAYTSIENSFAYGAVTSKPNNSGGLFGSVNVAPSLSNVYWNYSVNSYVVDGSASLTGTSGKNTTEFSSLADSDLGGSGRWTTNSSYAYPVLGLSALDDRLNAYNGSVMDVTITSGTGGS